MNISYFTSQLLSWYPRNSRDLPWRRTKDPYFIWLSEIILQQTRVAQGLPYFEAFTEKFPTVNDLASASEEEVLRCWQGLGYYSRARNLHACAKEIVHDRGGKFPNTYKELLVLKGVGPYTAAAIASFAFKEPVAAVDGNVFRVLARYFGITADIGSGSGKKQFDKLANDVIPNENPDTYNQAIMEFGALQCVPKNPDCHNCVLHNGCFAYQHNEVQNLPVKLNRTKVRDRYFHYFHIQCGDKTIVKTRKENDIWKGLIDFPLEEYQQDSLTQPEDSIILKDLSVFKPNVSLAESPTYKHVLSHQVLYADFTEVTVPKTAEKNLETWAKRHGYELITSEKLENVGKPKLIVNYLNKQN